jgi:hypothetical protein
MSAYRVIQTEFRNLDSLVKALADIGYAGDKVETAGTINTLSMYDWHSQLRPQTCAVRIHRVYVGGAANDVGFAWNGSTYEAIISDFDRHNAFNDLTMGKLKQSYAFHELSRQARAKGYTVQQEATPQGTIRMKLVRR